MIELNIGCLQTRDSDDAWNAAGGQEVIFFSIGISSRNCAVYECSNRENTRSFHRVWKCVVHKGKSQEIDWKMQEKMACKPASAVDRSRSPTAMTSYANNNKNRTRRIQFTQTHQNWTTEDCKNVGWSDESWFLLRHSDVGSEFGVKNMKAWIILPCLNGSGCWWWCNGVGDIFLAHFGLISTNWASFKHHSLPEYCCWPCPSLYDYSVPSSDVLPAG